MAVRTSNSNIRQLYVGTDTEAYVSDGNVVVEGNVGIGETSPGAKLDIVGGGTSTSPTLELNSSTSSTFNHAINAFNSNLTTGENQIIVVGKEGSTKNSGYIGYKWIGDGSDDNLVTIGHWASDNLVNIDALGNVGIGTTNPLFTIGSGLEIEKSGTATLRLQSSGSHASEINQTSSALQIVDLSSGTMLFKVSNDEKMRINSSGNVGIGETNPSTKLHVSSSENANWTTTVQNTLNSNSHQIYTAYNNNSTNARYGIYIQGAGTTASDYHLLINSQFAVLGNGNVGIGTTDPGVKLDIDGGYGGGSVRIKGDQPAGAYYYGYMYDGTNLKGTTQTNIFYSGSTIAANTTIAEYAGLRIDAPNVTATGAVVTNNYGIYQSGSVQKNYFAGNVGIGTTGPGYKLDVSGTARTTTGTYLGTSSGNVIVGGTTSDLIGGFKFIAIGNTAVQYGASTGTYLRIEPGAADTEVALKADARSGAYPPMTLYTSDSERMRISSTGNVGIGQTNPSHALHVHSDTDNDYVARFEGSTNNAAGVWTGIGIGGEAANTKSAIIFEDIGVSFSRGKLHLAVNNETNQSNATKNDAKLTISNNGYVGIGETNPDATLTIRTDSSAGYVKISSDGNGAVYSSNGDIQLYTNDAAYSTNIYSANKGSLLLRVLNNGNVGIGTTNPSYKLDVNGAIRLGQSSDIPLAGITHYTNGYLYIKGGASGAAMGNQDFGSSIYLPNDDTVQLVAGAAERMRIASNGNVGIGTTTPGSELEVDGEITTTTITYPEPGVLDSSAYNGEIVYFGSEISMAAGNLMVLSVSAAGLTWYQAKDSTNSLATGMLGIALGTTASAGLLVRGIAKNSAWSSFPAGDKLYLSPTGGAISNSITVDTNDFVRIVGYALGNSKIYFCPDNTYIQNA
jgi:hypothetical protein